MKFLKRSTYIRYVIAKLSKLVQIGMLALRRFFFTEDYLEIEKGLELVSGPHFP